LKEEAAMPPSAVTVDEVKSWMDQERAPVFVDARSAESWSKSSEAIPQSIRVPPGEAEAHLGEVPRGRSVVTYCT
jgi:rhodanese-related sulfurtransferase